MGDVTIEEFKKMDIRVGTITHAEVPKWSHYVMKLKVDVGQIQENPSTSSGRSGRTKKTIVVFAGIMDFFKPKELIGKQSLFIVNLEPKKIGPEGDMSEGMMLMATPMHKASNSAEASMDKSAGEAEEELPPVLLVPKKKVANGTKIM
jgi:tRNA-binding EMAP/Myf-like protein